MLHRFRLRRGATIAVTTSTALAAVGVASFATGAIPSGSDGVIHACYSSDGSVRVIDKEAGKTCNKGWTALSWNQRGPQGPQGPQGERGTDGQDGAPGKPGPRGLSKVYATFKDEVPNLPDTFENYGTFDFGREPVVTLPLPAGDFHIQAKGFANGEAGNVGCVLRAGPNWDGSIATLPGDRAAEPLVMQMLQHFSEPAHAELRCTDYGGTARGLFYIKVHATQVDSFNVVNPEEVPTEPPPEVPK